MGRTDMMEKRMNLSNVSPVWLPYDLSTRLSMIMVRHLKWMMLSNEQWAMGNGESDS